MRPFFVALAEGYIFRQSVEDDKTVTTPLRSLTVQDAVNVAKSFAPCVRLSSNNPDRSLELWTSRNPAMGELVLEFPFAGKMFAAIAGEIGKRPPPALLKPHQTTIRAIDKCDSSGTVVPVFSDFSPDGSPVKSDLGVDEGGGASQPVKAGSGEVEGKKLVVTPPPEGAVQVGKITRVRRKSFFAEGDAD